MADLELMVSIEVPGQDYNRRYTFLNHGVVSPKLEQVGPTPVYRVSWAYKENFGVWTVNYPSQITDVMRSGLQVVAKEYPGECVEGISLIFSAGSWYGMMKNKDNNSLRFGITLETHMTMAQKEAFITVVRSAYVDLPIRQESA